MELIDNQLVKISTPFVSRMLLFLNERASNWIFFRDTPWP